MATKQYNLGLALSGGGAKGFAHCGALKALEEFGLKPDIIAGTSAGAIVGALYAAGNTPVEIIKMFMGREFGSFVKMRIPINGFFDHSPFIRFLSENLRVNDFGDLKIPLYVIASDLDNGRSVVFSEGILSKSLQASCSIPILFPPVEIDGVHYVDGGIFRNFPVVPIRSICDEVIGINVSPLVSDEYKQNILQIAQRSYHFMFKANSMEDRKLCDYLVEIQEAHHYSAFDLENIRKIFQAGYESTVYALENRYNRVREIEQELIDFKD